jgi:hypothetical protein
MQAIERGNSDRNQFASVTIRASRADKGFEVIVAVVLQASVFVNYPTPF